MNTLVLKGATTHDRHKLIGDGLAANCLLYHRNCDWRLFKESRSEFVINIAKRADECVIGLVHFIHLVGRKLFDNILRAHGFIFQINNRLFVDDIKLATEIIFLAERDEHRPGIRLQLGAHIVQRICEVRTRAVHLVHESDTRHTILGRLTPDSLGLRLHTSHCAEYCNSTIENAERTLHLGREVHVSGRINDVDAHFLLFKKLHNAHLLNLLPKTSRRRRRDRNTTLTLLLHPVRDGRALMHLTDPVDAARIKQNALRQRRLARINVRGNTDVPRLFERICAVW